MTTGRDASPRDVDSPALTKSLTRWLTAGLFAGVALVGAFPAYRAVEATRRDEAVRERETALIASGHELWTAGCAECHGDNGEGVDAPALNAAEFFDVTTKSQMHHLIQSGVPGTDMAAWWNEFGGPFTDEQIDALVAYIFSLEEDAPSRPDWRDPEGMEGMGHGGEGGGPADTLATITVTDSECTPLELDVPAGAPFTLSFENQGSGSRSLEFQAVDEHIHAKPGEATPVSVPALDPGEYRFECLGTGHGTVLGSGVVRAAVGVDAPSAAPAGDEAAPPGSGAPRITVTDTECTPLDLEVEAETPLTLEFANEGSGSRSLEFQAVDEHIHAKPGEVTLVNLPALDPGEYRFECLGTGHGTVLGSGVVRAVAPS